MEIRILKIMGVYLLAASVQNPGAVRCPVHALNSFQFAGAACSLDN